jgi:methyl-accepting chemotaxis protein
MTKQGTSPLVEATTAFDAELATYTRLGELFLRSPLDTLKHIERANGLLEDLAKSEGRLQEIGQQLVAALAQARERQQALGTSVVERAPALKERNEQLRDLVAALAELASSVAELAQRGPADTTAADIDALSTRAKDLASSARSSGFAELADQAHALYQRLEAIAKKLHRSN